jgi:ABC-2 type transport system permease protein
VSGPSGPTGPTTGPTARILDQGYRHYDGPRGGSRAAVRAVIKATMQRSFGLKRSARFKVVPLVTAIMSYLPAVVFIGVAALLPADVVDELSFGYSDYYGFVTAAIVLFVSFVAPEVLCTDRRSGMLGLYLSGPLDRLRYLGAKAAAIASVLATVTLGPTVLLLIGFVLADDGPDGLWPLLRTIIRIVASAAVVTVWYTSLSMAVASLTDRRAFASASIILSVLIPQAVTSALVSSGLPSELKLADLFALPFELVRRVYGERGVGEIAELSTSIMALAALGYVTVFAGVVLWRYRSLEVTR